MLGLCYRMLRRRVKFEIREREGELIVFALPVRHDAQRRTAGAVHGCAQLGGGWRNSSSAQIHAAAVLPTPNVLPTSGVRLENCRGFKHWVDPVSNVNRAIATCSTP